MLPRSEEHETLLTQLSDTVRAQGGSALVFVTQTTSTVEHEGIVARFKSDRAREYSEFTERAKGFLEEIERETQLQKFTFAELEEIEDDYHKLAGWLSKIRKRDFFPDSNSDEATTVWECCTRELRDFAESVYNNEGLTISPDEASSDGSADM